MCSKEDVEKIVAESECRSQDRLERSHTALAGTISNFGAEITEMKKILKDHTENETEYQTMIQSHLQDTKKTLENLAHLSEDDVKALKDIAQGYAGMGAVRKLIIGLASIVLAIGAVVGGFITIVKAIK